MKTTALCAGLAMLAVLPCLAQPKPSPTPRPTKPLDEFLLRPDFWTVPLVQPEATPAEAAPAQAGEAPAPNPEPNTAPATPGSNTEAPAPTTPPAPTPPPEPFKALAFEWTSAAKASARSVGRNTFKERPIFETLISCKDGIPVSAVLYYYNRGDAGSVIKDTFNKMVAAVTADLTAISGTSPTDLGREASNAVRAEGLVWQNKDRRFVLEWSVTKESVAKMTPFRAEFLRLTITPPLSNAPRAIGSSGNTPTSRDIVKAFKGTDHIDKAVNGDVKLRDVPMVDQGSKGYCVVASVDRVMQYYGVQTDQHELAQIADSDASGGTSVDAMVGSLKKLTARLGVKIKSPYEWNYRDFMELIKDYNRAAKRAKAPEIEIGYSSTMESIYRRIQPDVYKTVRVKDSSGFGKFQREVQRSIDEGIPVLWGVRLGLVKEKEIPQAFGGHMRLIIGYNLKTREIIYSDSWGMGHEEKRMAMDDAWTITDTLARIEPLSKS